MSSNLNLSIGIDLGTTNSCAAIFRNGKVEIIPNDLGSHTTPSYVAFTENQRFVGQPAKDQLIKNLTNTIFSIKRLMGRNWDDRFVQKEIKKFPFEVKEENSRPYVRIERAKKGKRTFSAEEISAMILKKIVKSAEIYLNEEIKNVVITVPAYFNDAQRQATKNAGIIAGLNVLRIINEPTAAAIAYGLHSVKDEKTIVVYDLGGGTLDVSILKIKDGSLTVLATCGNSHLGGEDFDQNVINYFIKWYKTRKNIDFTNNNRAIQRLRKEVEKSKRLLTFSRSSTIEINSFLDDEDFSETLTRAKFEELNRDLFYSTLESLRQALMDAKLTKNDIDEIVMVGGSSRIPKIQEIVKFFFNGKEPFHQINPDEAVAYGAAIQAAILTGQQDSLKIQDVNPLSLGFAIKSNRMKIMIPRNTSIPTKKIDKVTTSKDFQKTMSFSLYEGEIPIASENLFLGKLRLTDIESAPKGVPKIEVKFEIDENGILEVFAENIVTNEKQNINIDYQKNRPTKEEIDEMIKISEEYDKLEENYNKTVNLRIELTELVYNLKESVEINNITNKQKIKLQKIVDDNLKWLEVQKIYSIEEYDERIEQIKNAVSSIVFEPNEE